MAEELQGILDKINAEGIQKAEAAKAEILSAARQEAEALTQRAESAISQAARDVILSLRSELESRINRAVFGCVSAALTPEFMAELIRNLADKFADSPDDRLTVLCAVRDEAELSRLLRGALADSLKNEPRIFGNFEINGGMEVSFRNGEFYFDFTNQAIAELISGYVGPMLGRLVEGK